MGNDEGIRCLCTPLTVPATEIGDVLPDRSGEPSECILEGASRSPVALVLEDPTAGAAFWPSVLPTSNRCPVRNVSEFDAEITDSVGLLGRFEVDAMPATPWKELEGAAGGKELRQSRCA